ncbi:ribosome-inactivating family protein [Streptomyces sp. NPDC059063]|uniref:ribosome-inactivating family protein n=1 Tax=unclassified Streptomyces TaxID=2593676 RepID=UPI0036CB5D82
MRPLPLPGRAPRPNRLRLAAHLLVCALLAGLLSVTGAGRSAAAEATPMSWEYTDEYSSNGRRVAEREYVRLLRDIRSWAAVRIRDGRSPDRYSDPRRTDPARTMDFLPLRLTAMTGEQVTLRLRASDLYVVGFWIGDVYYYFSDHTDLPPPGNMPGGARALRYGSSYGDIERRADRARGQVTASGSGGMALSNAVRDLARSDPDDGVGGPRALLVLAQMIAEATRFSVIENQIRDNWSNADAYNLPYTSVGLENSWQPLSAEAIRNRQSLSGNDLAIAQGGAADAEGSCTPSGSRPTPTPTCDPGATSLVPLTTSYGTGATERMNFFSYATYTAVDAPPSGEDRILDGPTPTTGTWPALDETGLSERVDAALPVPNTDTAQAWFFSGDQYARIETTPAASPNGQHVIVGRRSIKDNWPSLAEAGFDRDIDAALVVPGSGGRQAWFFKGDQFIKVRLDVGGRGDELLSGPGRIRDSWGPLSQADSTPNSDVPTHFTSSLTGAATVPGTGGKEAYFFSGSQYVRIAPTPGSNDDRLIEGPADIAAEWPSLREAGYFMLPDRKFVPRAARSATAPAELVRSVASRTAAGVAILRGPWQ